MTTKVYLADNDWDCYAKSWNLLGSEQSIKQEKASKTEELKEDRSIADTISITYNTILEEILITDNSFRKNVLYSPCDIGSITYRKSY